MDTLTKIKAHAMEIMDKAKSGQPLTVDDIKILKMATPSGTAGNAGKRIKRTNKQH